MVHTYEWYYYTQHCVYGYIHIIPGNGGPNTSWFIASTQLVVSSAEEVLIEYFILEVRISNWHSLSFVTTLNTLSSGINCEIFS